MGRPVALLVAVLALAACGEDEPPVEEARTSPAVWRIDPERPPATTDDTFRVEVHGVECDSGEETEPVPPEVEESAERVVIRFSEPAPTTDGFQSCEQNVEHVTYVVELAAPIGDRALVDAECLEGSLARNTGFCDGGEVRYEDGRATLVRW